MPENHATGARGGQNDGWLPGRPEKYWLTLPIVILVTLIYVWFVSAGTWTTWISATHLYDDLARGFRAGHLYLPIKANQKLPPVSDLKDNSSGVRPQGPLDVSYFNGKYYLYWGPVPALVVLLVHTFVARSVGDLQLTFGFLIGIFVLECLLAVLIWQRFFTNLPRQILWASILLMGLASPATFLLDSTRSARIYEAAITGGQFFLVGGFIAALTALSRPISRWRLACAGTLWALAIGSRLVLALPTGFMVLMVAWWIVRTGHLSRMKLTQLAALGLPLTIGLACLGWYNWARFGSILETGFSYQMTTIPDFQQHSGEFIRPIFIVQNLYNYALNPLRLQPDFPYLYAQYGNTRAIFSSYPLPSFYASQIVTGLIYTTPFLVFAIVPLVVRFGGFGGREAFHFSANVDDGHLFNWLLLSLGASSLVTFGILLSYFWTAARFTEDLMPSLIMLAVIGFWQGYQALSTKRIASIPYHIVGICLLGASILLSTLVALSVNYVRFDIARLLSSSR